MVRHCFLLGLASLLFLILLNSPPAQAHVLKSDGAMNAILHINPNDDPVAGQTDDFLFDIFSNSNTFNLSDCNCKATLTEGARILYTGALKPLPAQDHLGSIFDAGFSTFIPRKDVYEVTLAGVPLSSGSFPAFTLVWDVRVDQAIAQPSSSLATGVVISLITVVVIVVLAITIISYRTMQHHNGKPKTKR